MNDVSDPLWNAVAAAFLLGGSVLWFILFHKMIWIPECRRRAEAIGEDPDRVKAHVGEGLVSQFPLHGSVLIILWVGFMTIVSIGMR